MKTHSTMNRVLRLRLACVVLILAVLVLSTGCGGRKEPDPLPSQTATQVTPQLEPPPQLPPPIRQVRPTRPTTVKVIDPGGEEDPELSLYEASERAKALDRTGDRVAVTEINDENLRDYAEKAEIIMIEGDPAVPPPSLGSSPEPTAEPLSARNEKYWRDGALEIRMNWRRTLDRIDELELESAALRQQFYTEEDPYVRDNHIKPDWDRVLDQISALQEREDRYEQELEQFLEEGRLAGAQPGWLSEGWELEPEPPERTAEETEPFSVHQAGEPQVVDEVIDP